MSERVTRINDCKVELGRCELNELYAMLGYIAIQKQRLESQEQEISEHVASRLAQTAAPLEEVA